MGRRRRRSVDNRGPSSLSSLDTEIDPLQPVVTVDSCMEFELSGSVSSVEPATMATINVFINQSSLEFKEIL